MRVLIVDDETNIREIFVKLLAMEGIDCESAENGFAAQRIVENIDIDIIVSDLKMPGMDGLELLAWLKEQSLDIPVIMISAFGQADDAVQALKLGAYDYMVKPFDPDVLIHRIKNASDAQTLKKELLSKEKNDSYIAHSLTMKHLKTRIQKIAPTPSTVLITGESGSGKEVTARYIHQLSGNREGPFLSINVGGIPEELLESELFGHEKGSFTGAERRKIGLFEAAAEGTLFLDEIGEMSAGMQVKLLRVLQEKTIRRLGGLDELPIKARIISATNRTLENSIKEGSFREDLFYRLNVARIELPPLRERKEDIIPLTTLLLKNLNIKMGSSINSISPEAVSSLESYPYPGNIRELENILERACIYAEGTIISSDDLELQDPSRMAQVHDKPGSLHAMEKEMILESLLRWEGNRTKAAKELGISRRTIQNKLIEYGMADRLN
ncbi:MULTISPECIES: sigma-54 dependent transcriptional regulator [unclassified Oceanispirochaeta]|uniref:sigma-54-dependent transcriptional regulator n=1 Tax=unclassified Oceanispirochaeta TaxID=2635722 RepID=UPI000E09A08B|nr:MULTISPECIES: sigma-54 dependent transcriptional regulator [unclassified Oceanispirochaeta]MBF9017542.1 sigma-54-dependent Fis family transcriptional regulator [Oceanispirochaeta sp. M2]NPD74114.1 sigma-54-dependent Fis family transcriptional regulator [Oceanispirochaeta sp. M1]RDG30036.1 sigma-54-dependent Fis family transcriptional regulator [Oceanispirochaeta sp. M1]